MTTVPGRGILNGLLILGAAVVIGVGVAMSPAGVLAAASVGASVVLVAVTAWYVVLTRQLVEAQGKTLAHAQEVDERRATAATKALQRQGYIEVWQVCHSFVLSVESLKRTLAPFSSPDSTFADAASAVKSLYDDNAEEFEQVGRSLTAASLNLPEGRIHTLVWEVGVRMTWAANMLSSLQIATLQARLDARSAEREPQLGDIERLWSGAFRPKSHEVEWGELITGEAFEVTSERLDELEVLTFEAARDGISG